MSRSRDQNRIVFILPAFAAGGAENQLANLIHHRPQEARGIDVHTITFLPTTSQVVEARFAQAGATNTLVDRSSLGFRKFFIELLRVLRVLQPMTVSTFLDSSVGAWGRLAAVLTRVPVIVHSDRSLATEGTRLHYLLRPHLDRRTRRFLPNATAIAERLMTDGVPEAKIEVMPNGVDLEVFDPPTVTGMRSDLGIAEDAVILGYLGRFAPSKRVDLLLHTLRQIPVNQRPDIVLLAGDGPTMAEARSIADSDEWLKRHCRFLGTIHNTPAFMATIDYLVLPSEIEGLPNVILEAMAMGKPVLSTNISDIPDLIGDSGFIVEPGDANQLAGGITRLQELGATGRQELGARARARIEKHYSIAIAARRFWQAHLELVGNGKN